MAGGEHSAQAPGSPCTGGRAALAEAVGSMWSALVLGLLAAIFAWFWFGGSDESEDHRESAVPGGAEPSTEPVEEEEEEVGVGGQQQATRAEAAPVRAEEEEEEAAATEHLLKSEETSVCKVKTNYENQTDELNMGQSQKHDNKNQKDLSNFEILSETSAAYPLPSELEVVFPSAEGASSGHEVVPDSLIAEATQCEAQEALLGPSSTAEGAQSSVQATVLDNEVLQRGQKDAMDTFTGTEAESSAQEAVLDATAVQSTMQEAALGAFTDAEKSIVHKDVSDVSPAAIVAAPIILHKAVMHAYTSAEAVQFNVQKDELAVKQFSGLEHEWTTEAAHGIMENNGLVTDAAQHHVHEYLLATKATPTVLQKEVLDAEATHTSMQEDGLDAEAAHVPKDGLEVEIAYTAVPQDRLDSEAAHTTLQEDGLDAEAAHTTVQQDGLHAEATCTAVQEDGLDAEAAHTTVQQDGLHTEATCTAVQEDRMDAGVVLANLHEDRLHIEAAHTTVQEDVLDTEAPHAVVHKDQLDTAAHATVAEDVLDAEAAHGILNKDGLDSETHTTMAEDGLDAKATHASVQEDDLEAAAQSSIVQEAFVDFLPAAKDIPNICAASKEQELLLHTVSQKLGYINGQEVIDYFAGGHETSTHKGVPTDSNATKELETLRNSSHVSDENSNQLYMSEPQPRNIDGDSKTRKIAAVTPMPQYVIVKFRVHYITHSESQLIAVTGNHESLGEWNIYVPLKPDKDGFWADSVLLPVDSGVEWKFVMVENGKIKRWEECTNRYLKTGHDDTEAHQWWGYH